MITWSVFFYKQPVCKQLASDGKFLSNLVLNPLLLSNNKNYRLGENVNVKQLLNRQYIKVELSQKQFGEKFFINIDFESWKLMVSSKT